MGEVCKLLVAVARLEQKDGKARLVMLQLLQELVLVPLRIHLNPTLW